jgi:hypothetical protein
MKLTEPDTKLKLKRSNLLSLNSYLYELLTNTEDYFAHISQDKTFKHILIHNIKTVYEKVSKILFKNAYITNEFKTVFSLNEAEKLTLIKLTSLYALPMDINFIEYELTKKLIK